MTPSLRRQTPPPPAAANGRARWPPRCPGGGARLEEAEQGWGRGDRSPGGGTGARGGASGPAGLRTGTPGDEDARPSPSPRRLAASPRGGAGRPESLGVSKVWIHHPGRSLRAAVPPGTGRQPPPRPGPASTIARCRSRKSGGAAGLRTRRRPRHPPRGAPALPPPPLHSRPPSSRVTRVDGRRGARAGPWRSR